MPGEVAELKFNLYPTSVLIKAGHRLRVAIAGHDAWVFDRYPTQGTPLLSVGRNSIYPSRIERPIK